MARQTRQQRRERRQQDGLAPAAAAPPRRPPRGPVDAVPEERVERRPVETRRRSFIGRSWDFIRECWGELQKVEWPGQRQVIQGTVVVLIACLVVGVYLYACDQAFKNLVEKVFLR
jgi:preprotein translocase SecE subunit